MKQSKGSLEFQPPLSLSLSLFLSFILFQHHMLRISSWLLLSTSSSHPQKYYSSQNMSVALLMMAIVVVMLLAIRLLLLSLYYYHHLLVYQTVQRKFPSDLRLKSLVTLLILVMCFGSSLCCIFLPDDHERRWWAKWKRWHKKMTRWGDIIFSFFASPSSSCYITASHSLTRWW